MVIAAFAAAKAFSLLIGLSSIAFCATVIWAVNPVHIQSVTYIVQRMNSMAAIQEGDIVMINTGFHKKWADSDEYFAYGCGISGAGAQWLVDKKVKCVGYGCQANDHPIATKLVDHGLGPSQPHLIQEYKDATGRDPKEDFPDWEPAHKTLMVKGGIPGIENVGGDLDKVTGKRCFFVAFPWRWPGGDGCIMRILAIVDPDQTFKFENGQ